MTSQKTTTHAGAAIKWLALFFAINSGHLFAQTGTGLTGKYYDDLTFVTAVTTRTEPRINFDFASAIPKRTATTVIPNGGAVMREVWTGLAGASITTLTSSASYPNKPASREFITSFECIAQSWEDEYGTRATGFIRAPVSGSYTFAVNGDEAVVETAKILLIADADPRMWEPLEATIVLPPETDALVLAVMCVGQPQTGGADPFPANFADAVSLTIHEPSQATIARRR